MVYLFVLIATATMEPASGRAPFQTVGYHATAAECQHALIKAEASIDTTYVKLKCQPIRAVK
jgi:hypothetical protein